MENFFDANSKPYRCQESVTSTVSPWDKAIGGISCGSIDKALSRALGGNKRAGELVKSLDPKQDPKAQKRGGMSLNTGCDESTFYNNYVFTDKAGKHWLFIDVKMSEKPSP